MHVLLSIDSPRDLSQDLKRLVSIAVVQGESAHRQTEKLVQLRTHARAVSFTQLEAHLDGRIQDLGLKPSQSIADTRETLSANSGIEPGDFDALAGYASKTDKPELKASILSEGIREYKPLTDKGRVIKFHAILDFRSARDQCVRDKNASTVRRRRLGVSCFH